MEFVISLNGKEILVKWLQKPRLKNLYMRIENSSTLQIKSNIYITKFDIIDFINKKQEWILKNIEKIDKNKLLEDEFFFLGNIYKYEKYSLKKEGLQKFYKTQAKLYLPTIVNEYSHIMQLFPTKLSFRDNKSRWGSCSFNNSINLNINLMKLDIELITYVVVHELAHIKHKNHSKRFYEEIEKVLPNYREFEKKLKYF